MLIDVLGEWQAEEVSAMDIYGDIFRLGDNVIQKQGEEPGQFKANPIVYYRNKNADTGHYRILFDDTFEEILKEAQAADFAIINGLTYFGRNNKMENASKMYAMIIDLDGVTDKTLNAFLSGAYRGEAYPIPNYVILSGHGVHLYYLLEQPVPLYPNIKIQLKNLKYALIDKVWNLYTSKEKRKQYQGINQGFRPVGGKTKIEGVKVRAFRLNTHPFTLEQLGQYIPEQYRVDESKLYKESRYTLEEAKKKFPVWYEERITNKRPRQSWTCKRDLYDWWLRQIRQGASYGHRYFCIMALAIYATKSGITAAELKKDAINLIPYLNDLNPSEPFKKNDVISALECFDTKYVTFPRGDIEKITNIVIPPNKRNYRKQADHLKRARAVQAVDYPNGEWRRGNGRPKGSGTGNGKPYKAHIVEKWQRENPNGTKAECIRETGLSKPTVYKHWKNHA